jgi:hypothetical protein
MGTLLEQLSPKPVLERPVAVAPVAHPVPIERIA